VRAIFALVLILTCFVATTPALANHEGPYIVGEEKYLDTRTIFCKTKKAILHVFSNISNPEKRFDTLQTYAKQKECGMIRNVRAIPVGQVENDKTDTVGTVWRIVHIQLVEEMEELKDIKDLYLLVYGSSTKVIQRGREIRKSLPRQNSHALLG